LGGRRGCARRGLPGRARDDRANIEKLLGLLEGVSERRARFRCVAVLVWPTGEELLSEGILWGQIARAPRGTGGVRV
jgi:XTP/dITP diphosphohydrolase